MTHNEVTNNKSKFVVATVALLFCITWALVGEANIKIVAVAIAFICFLKAGIELEMSVREASAGH